MTERLPRVSEILEACGLGVQFPMPAGRREWYLARGSALHKAIELDAAGELDETSVHSEIAPGLDAYRKFVAATGHTPLILPGGQIASELELCHPRWRYMGHPDRVGWVNGNLSLLDWKSSVDPKYVSLQLAAYGLLWRDAHPDHPLQEFLAVRLGFDGTWSIHQIDPRQHEQTFLAAVVLYRALEERGRLKETP